MSFESPFPGEMQAEAAGLFRRARHSLGAESSTLCFRSATGIPMELNASLFCVREEGRAVSMRCVFRDVTSQNRRERRLALQLTVSQIIVEAVTSEEGLPRVLEALCTSLGWDFAALWEIDEAQETLRCRCTWTAPEAPCTMFLHETSRSSYRRGEGLPGSIWSRGEPMWIDHLADELAFNRKSSAAMDNLISGWGMPIRVGNQVIAVAEFFARRRKLEDTEMIATVQTVCASLGQFIARSAQELHVRELNRQKEFILNSVADGILGIDAAGRLDFVNPSASRMLGASASHLVGHTFHAVVHGPLAEACAHEGCTIAGVLAQKQAATAQGVFYRQDKNAFPVELSFTPLFDSGAVAGGVISFHDISERQALDQMKDEFISTVSHELRTPLTSIRGALGLLSAGVLGTVSDKAANLMRIAVSNSDRLVRLINDILDLERMQSGRAPFTPSALVLPELIQQAVENMRPMSDAAKVQLVIDCEQLEIEADPDRLLQVLGNLISNAIKFSDPGTTVRIKTAISGKDLLISVIDQGRGIPVEKLETIFERFQQVNTSDARQKGGTGLGLAICRTILQQHHGRIWAEQNPDKGATFHVLLPFSDAALALQSESKLQSNQETVLICAAPASSRAAIAESLTRHGYKALEAESSHQAIAMASKSAPGAILLDISLPGLNGWQTLRTLKGDSATANIPVMVVSLLASGEQVRMHDGWVSHPINDQLVLEELARVLPRSGERATVLLVEDDADLAEIILTTFERAGINICHAPTYRRAIELCQESHPDLMILDLALPDGNGLQVVEWLREHEDLQSLPLVVYSAREVSGVERQRLRLGPTEFITKAKVQPQEVESLVIALLSRARGDADSTKHYHAISGKA